MSGVDAVDNASLVTVVIPCRNEAGSIGGAIQHVLAQEYPPGRMEVVVVDGASSDGSDEVARAALMGTCLRRWAVLGNAAANTPSNLNRGLAWAEGSLVVRVDARSLIPVDYVARVVGTLSDPDVTVVGGRQVAVARGAGVVETGIARALNNRWGMGLSRYRRGSAASGPADTVYLGAFRRDDLEAAGGWNEAFPTNQDFELNRRLSQKGIVWFDAELSVEYAPRRTLAALFQQYHRFGRWKMRYWRATGDRPRPRQVVILAAPVAAAMAVGVLASRHPATLVAAALALTGAAVEHGGSAGAPAAVPVRVVALTALGAVAVGWWSGVARELLRPQPFDACRSASTNDATH